VQILQIVVNVSWRKMVFAIVTSPGPRTSDAVFGVRGGVLRSRSFDDDLGSVRESGAAREPGGAGDIGSTIIDVPSLTLCASGRSGCVQWFAWLTQELQNPHSPSLHVSHFQ
jgi:hypothetical protein